MCPDVAQTHTNTHNKQKGVENTIEVDRHMYYLSQFKGQFWLDKLDKINNSRHGAQCQSTLQSTHLKCTKITPKTVGAGEFIIALVKTFLNSNSSRVFIRLLLPLSIKSYSGDDKGVCIQVVVSFQIE